MNKEKVIDKIQKLIAMQTSSNQNEVENALLLAEQLKRKYEISENQLKQIQSNEIGIVSNNLFIYTRPPWMFSLVNGIAKYYDCKIIQRKYQKVFSFIGYEFDTQVAVKMAEYVISSIQGIAEREANKQEGITSKRRWKLNFLWAAVSAICVRLDTMKKEQNMKDNDCRTLVVCKDKNIKDYMDKEFSNLKTKKLYRRMGVGSIDGYKAGSQLSLQIQIK